MQVQTFGHDRSLGKKDVYFEDAYRKATLTPLGVSLDQSTSKDN